MQFTKAKHEQELPDWIDRHSLATFLHENLDPYQDSVEDIERGLDYAFSRQSGKGGFALLAHEGHRLIGALVMLRTGMQGYIPPNLLLFVAVEARQRGNGTGRKLCEAAIAECEGDVCLHVEYDNPAKRLYERIGFASKYAEMRYLR